MNYAMTPELQEMPRSAAIQCPELIKAHICPLLSKAYGIMPRRIMGWREGQWEGRKGAFSGPWQREERKASSYRISPWEEGGRQGRESPHCPGARENVNAANTSAKLKARKRAGL